MSKIKLILFMVAIAVVVFGCWLIKYQYDKITALEAKKNELEATIEKARADEIQNGKRIKELREALSKSKEAMDWGNSLVNPVVVDILQKHYRESLK